MLVFDSRIWDAILSVFIRVIREIRAPLILETTRVISHPHGGVIKHNGSIHDKASTALSLTVSSNVKRSSNR